MKPTTEQIQEVQRKIRVMQDWCDGKQIQVAVGNSWADESHPAWNWWAHNYRTKPEPPTVWAADLDTEWPSFCVNYDPHVHAVRDWKKYTLHEVLS